MTLTLWAICQCLETFLLGAGKGAVVLERSQGPGKCQLVCQAECAFILSREVAMAGIRVGRALVVETTLMRAIWGAGAMGEEKRQEINSL